MRTYAWKIDDMTTGKIHMRIWFPSGGENGEDKNSGDDGLAMLSAVIASSRTQSLLKNKFMRR